MPQRHESFDYLHHAEPDLFASNIEGSVVFGQQFALLIRAQLEREGRQLPPQPTYLALAAGQSIAEFALAEALGIEDEAVTLVDRYFSPSSMSRIVRGHPSAAIVPDDMFRFLRRIPERPYDMVTVFGVDHVLRDQDKMRELVASMPRVLSMEGFACVCPYVGDDFGSAWRENGFERAADLQDPQVLVYIKSR